MRVTAEKRTLVVEKGVTTIHIFALVLLAGVLGAIHSYVAPKLQSAVPASVPQGRIMQALLTGAFILVSLFLAETVLWVVGVRERA